jgi:hypothetical protein
MEDEEKEGPGRFLKPLLLVAVFLALAAAIWWFAHQQTGIRRSAPQIQTITMVPPPPPPPPPPKTPPPPEQKVEETPRPEETPKTPSPPQQVTINGPAQAGSDAFGVQAGSGGGMIGSGGASTPGTDTSGLSEATYRRYLSGELTNTLQEDKAVNRSVFTAEVLIWMDGRRITRAQIARSTGDGKLDKAITASLERVSVDQAPTSGVRFPQRVVVHGRRGF